MQSFLAGVKFAKTSDAALSKFGNYPLFCCIAMTVSMFDA